MGDTREQVSCGRVYSQRWRGWRVGLGSGTHRVQTTWAGRSPKGFPFFLSGSGCHRRAKAEGDVAGLSFYKGPCSYWVEKEWRLGPGHSVQGLVVVRFGI